MGKHWVPVSYNDWHIAIVMREETEKHKREPMNEDRAEVLAVAAQGARKRASEAGVQGRLQRSDKLLAHLRVNGPSTTKELAAATCASDERDALMKTYTALCRLMRRGAVVATEIDGTIEWVDVGKTEPEQPDILRNARVGGRKK